VPRTRVDSTRSNAGQMSLGPRDASGRYPCPAGCDRTFTHAPAAVQHARKCKGQPAAAAGREGVAEAPAPRSTRFAAPRHPVQVQSMVSDAVTKPKATVEGALAYLGKVRELCGPRTEEALSQALEAFAMKRIDVAATRERISLLFANHPRRLDLLVGFNAFLPLGCEIDLALAQRAPSAARSVTPEYIAVIFDGDEVELTGGLTAMQATAERAAAAEARGDVVAIDV